MNGSPLTHIQQNGRMLLKMTLIAVILSVLFCGCSSYWLVGDGRGDWTLDLKEGYAISRINSREILLIHKENPDDAGGEIVISNYFITAYQLYEPYICLEGIKTQGMAASEDELNNMVLSYYIIDTTSAEVIGPFESQNGFIEHWSSLGINLEEEWIKTSKKTGDG